MSILLRLLTLTLLAACTSDPADDVVDVVDTPADTVDPFDPVDTPEADTVDAPESECRAAPAELVCGEGERAPFVPRSDGQEVTMNLGPDGQVGLFLAGQLRNTDQTVRLWQRVTDLRTGDVLSEGRILSVLHPSQDGPWACEGYYAGFLAMLQFEGLGFRELGVALCGHEALIEMASEDIDSAADAPTVYAASSVHIILRPGPVWEITCD